VQSLKFTYSDGLTQFWNARDGSRWIVQVQPTTNLPASKIVREFVQLAWT
jgi:hypothetical protein